MRAGTPDRNLSPAFDGASFIALPSLTEGITALHDLARNAPLMLREAGEKTTTGPLQSLMKYMPHFFSLYLPVVARADDINGPFSYVMEQPLRAQGYNWKTLVPLLRNLYRDSPDVCAALDVTARVAAYEEEWKAMIRSRVDPESVDHLRQACEALYRHEAPKNEFYAGPSRTFAPSLVRGG